VLGKRELIRRNKKAIELSQMANDELKKWVDGFITACAFLKLEKPDHHFFDGMPEPTIKQINQKVEEMANDKHDKPANSDA
jgi:hypothetical protein